VSSLEDCRSIDDTLDKVDYRLGDLDSQVEVHQQRVSEAIRFNTHTRSDVDDKRIDRCLNESSTHTLGQTRENYNILLNENNRLKNENMNLERVSREIKTELTSLNERKFMKKKLENTKKDTTKSLGLLIFKGGNTDINLLNSSVGRKHVTKFD